MHRAFLTGCGSGFGHRLAARLLSLGHQVVATDPDIDGLAEALCGQDPAARTRLTVLALDVRDRAQVASVTAKATAGGPIDLLVNNAGVAVFGSQEEVSLDAVRDMFEVNVFGAVAVTQALLPSLRSTSGTVVQLSSVAGRVVLPESGFYAASKHALEALSEALFQETCSTGVRVRLIEPGSFATRFLERAQANSPERNPSSPYSSVHGLWDARRTALLEPPQDPERVVDAIVASLADPAPFQRVVVGDDAERMLAVRAAIPADSWSQLAALPLGLDDTGADLLTRALTAFTRS
jgi:NAD(P)-dependent dehydrogenase (short-subunit alcohol dehydrogenase family)